MADSNKFYRWRPHPWHGLRTGSAAPGIVNAYIEITPFSMVKYEVDKETGYLRVDRPQRTSSQPPTLYGFIPQTYCGQRVCDLSPEAKNGDGDPLDICVISDRRIDLSEIIVRSRVIGGIRMIDNGEADDKIIAVMIKDNVWGNAQRLSDIPENFIERLCHYFSTYKYVIGEELKTSITSTYDVEHALRVVQASMEDYSREFDEFHVAGDENS